MTTAGDRLQLQQQQRLQQRLNIRSVMLGRVLEMNAPEFEDEIRRELHENPALEAVGEAPAPQEDFHESAGELQMADYADPDDIPHYRLEANNRTPGDRTPEWADFTADDTASAVDILMERLATETALTEGELALGRYIIGNLDENGYLSRTLASIADDVAENEGRDVDAPTMRRVFEAVRSLDPAGVGAVDLRDCLLLQLNRREPSPVTDLAREIVSNHFDAFTKKHYDRLEADTGATETTLAKAIDLIKSLNPRPALALGGGASESKSRHVTPDFVLDFDPAGDGLTLTLAGRTPELEIEHTFRTDPAGGNGANAASIAEARDFIKRKRDEAKTFIALVQMRAQTLMLIGGVIVDIQQRFFTTGDRADIAPMVLRDIAERTGLDISVISRAVAGKYILTPHGIFPLKLFFNEHPRSENTPGMHGILEKMRQLIENEDKDKPLSDRQLCELLADGGVETARRTIAKYRERLGYPVARLRKEYNK